MAGFLIALLSGALMSVQGVFNTQVTKSTGIWVSNGWVQLSAFALCVVVWLATGRESVSTLMGGQTALYVVGRVIGAGITWDSHSERFCPWTRTFCVIDCDCTACGFLSDPALRTFRNGSGAILVEKGRRTSSGRWQELWIFQLSGTNKETGKCFCQILRSVTNVIHL